MTEFPAVRLIVEGTYELFGGYEVSADTSFCTFCYDEDEIEALRGSKLRELDVELARRIAWETWDHWDSIDVYKHYLPRIVEFFSPPEPGRDLYVGHFFETLGDLDFATWPAQERHHIWRWVEAVEAIPDYVWPDDLERWKVARDSLGPRTRVT